VRRADPAQCSRSKALPPPLRVLLLAVSLVLGACGLATFLWCLRRGQYDDMEGATNRILFDDEPPGERRKVRGKPGPPQGEPG
jgi:cbb3-type cytochrome oxidase maturation protein